MELYNTVRMESGIAYVAPADKLAGRGEAIRTARKQKLPTGNARRRTKTKNEELAQPECCEVD